MWPELEVTYHFNFMRFWPKKKHSAVEGWSWFKFNNLGLLLTMALKFYSSVRKGLKLKVKKFWGLISTFGELQGENWYREGAAPPILNSVNEFHNSFIQVIFDDAVIIFQWHSIFFKTIFQIT